MAIVPIRRVATLHATEDVAEIERVVRATLVARRGRVGQAEGDWQVVHFGSAASFRIWGSVFVPGGARRMPIVVRTRCTRDEIDARVDVQVIADTEEGWYLARLPQADLLARQVIASIFEDLERALA